jgi:tripartite-type tricarboxylate transporter receptor subunit TctC
VLGGALVSIAFGTAQGQGQFPDRPLVNPLPAGGGVDIAMRGLAKEMQTILGHPVLVESRAGAGGTIAGTYVAQAKPDGYVGLFQSTQAIPEVYAFFQEPPYTSDHTMYYAQKNGFELYYGSEDDVRQELKRDREVTTALIEAMQKDKPAR